MKGTLQPHQLDNVARALIQRRVRKGSRGCIPPRLILWLWPLLDDILSRCLSIKPLREDKIGAITIEHRRYRGQPLELDNGYRIKPGDMMIELHLNKAWFLHRRKIRNSSTRPGWELASAFSEDLKYLAEQLVKGRFAPEIKAIHGITLLHPAARHLGFTVLELPDSLWKHLCQFYLAGLMQAYHFKGVERFAAGTKPLVVKEVWMSRPKLLEKYRG